VSREANGLEPERALAGSIDARPLSAFDASGCSAGPPGERNAASRPM
jgi:hypothetical protein